MNFDEFMDGVDTLCKQHSEYRYGQALFNHLYDVRPDLSEQIRTTDLDPFYTQDSQKLDKIKEWIKDNW